MPGLKVSVAHKLSQDEALRRVKAAIADAKKEYAEQVDDLQESWDGYNGTFSATAMGQRVSGSLAVNPSDVIVQGKLPLIALPFKGKFEAMIREQVAAILA
jgi:hypothetical protein